MQVILKHNYRKEGIRKYSLVQCPTCHNERDVRSDSLKANKSTYCRSCLNRLRERKKPEDLFSHTDYYHTPKGFAYSKYYTQVARSTKYDWQPPQYTKDDLYSWLITQPNFTTLWSAWESANYAKHLAPSIDRKDDYLPYSFSNIQLMTWDENNKKGAMSVLAGINTKKSKGVIQMTLDGVEIARYASQMEAERITGVDNSHIANCCLGYRIVKGIRKNVLSAGGFKWQRLP